MYNYSGGNDNPNNGYPYQPYQYQGGSYYYPPQPPRQTRRRSGWAAFIFVFLLIAGAAYLTDTYHFNLGYGGTVIQPDTGNSQIGFRLPANDPSLGQQQYALQRLDVNPAWQLTQGSSNVVVAVIDTGVDPTQPALQGKLVQGYDFVPRDQTSDDLVGHGTFVSSLIVGGGSNQAGLQGIAPNVRIMPLKVTNNADSTDTDTVAAAIRYAADNHANVINLSLGGPEPSGSMESAINYALGKGVVVVAAAGNEGNTTNALDYPAAFPGVISVAATGPRNTVAAFSNHNAEVAVGAPGVNIVGARSQYNQICSPYLTRDYCVASGTSFAAPYVAGTVALMLSENGHLSVSQVTSILESTAQALRGGRNDYSGYGLVDTGRAVQAAKTA